MQTTAENDKPQLGRRLLNLRTLVGVAIFIVFVVFVESYLGWARLLAPWRVQSVPALALAVALVMASYWLRALRLHDYFQQEMAGGLMLAFRLMLQHNLLNNLLPMRSGEIAFPVLMARYFGVPAGRSVPALLWFRVLDLHTLVLLALVAAGSAWFPGWMTLPVVLAWLTVPWWLHHFAAWLRGHLASPVPGRLGGLVVKMLQGLPQDNGAFWRAWGWTLANWAVKLAVFAWVLALFVDLPWAGALLGVISGEVTSVLPVHSVAGMGTYEAGIMAGLVPFGLTADSALQGAVNLHLFLLGVSLLGGAVSFGVGKRRGLG